MGEDLRLHHESVTVYCDEYAVKILMKLIVIDNSDRVKLVVSTHSAELDKLNFVFLRQDKLDQYIGIADILKRATLNDEATFQ